MVSPIITPVSNSRLSKDRAGQEDLLLKEIDDLDLVYVKEKLRRDDGWSTERCDNAEFWYRRFLKLCVLQGEGVVPLGDIDELWHTHILFTRKYHQDCDRIFGKYLHHRPMLGLNEEERLQNLEGRQNTDRLFKEFFGTSPLANDGCGCSSSGNCCSNDS